MIKLLAEKLKYVIFEQNSGFLKGMGYKLIKPSLSPRPSGLRIKQNISLQVQNIFCAGFVIVIIVLSKCHYRENWQSLKYSFVLFF